MRGWWGIDFSLMLSVKSPGPDPIWPWDPHVPVGMLCLKFTRFMKRGRCSINPEEGDAGALHTSSSR